MRLSEAHVISIARRYLSEQDATIYVLHHFGADADSPWTEFRLAKHFMRPISYIRRSLRQSNEVLAIWIKRGQNLRIVHPEKSKKETPDATEPALQFGSQKVA